MELGDYTRPEKSQANNQNQLPTQPKEPTVNMTPQQYKEHYNPKLEDRGLRIVNSGWDTFVNIFFVLTVVLILAGAGFFLYLVHEGKFQSNINQTVQPQINVTSNNPVSVQNSYSQPITNNVQVSLPSDLLTLCKQALNWTNSTGGNSSV